MAHHTNIDEKNLFPDFSEFLIKSQRSPIERMGKPASLEEAAAESAGASGAIVCATAIALTCTQPTRSVRYNLVSGFGVMGKGVSNLLTVRLK